jgi:hypothetical protein
VAFFLYWDHLSSCLCWWHFLLSVWKSLFDLPLQIYLAGPWLASQGRWVFWFLFIAVIILGVYVVPASEEFNKWNRLCLINHPSSLIGVGSHVGMRGGWGGFKLAWQFLGLEESFHIPVSSAWKSHFNNKQILWFALVSRRAYRGR